MDYSKKTTQKKQKKLVSKHTKNKNKITYLLYKSFIFVFLFIIIAGIGAGLGMVNGITTLVPSAKIGHIGLYRDPETHEPHEYYCKLPDPIEQRLIVLTDPMLATGGSAVDAVRMIKQHGGKNIKCMFVIAAPEGLERLHREHPDVQIYVGHLDRELNENAYICPGLGDAGDRIFGTI